MILRPFRKEDAAAVCGWIRTEKELYDWSADRYGCFPIGPETVLLAYAAQEEVGPFVPLTAEDGEGNVTGHLVIRRPDPSEETVWRFGFVILAPDARGRGLGQEMLRSAARYARDALGASRITLGVFEDNTAAVRCYAAAGFVPTGSVWYELPSGRRRCTEMELCL